MFYIKYVSEYDLFHRCRESEDAVAEMSVEVGHKLVADFLAPLLEFDHIVDLAHHCKALHAFADVGEQGDEAWVAEIAAFGDTRKVYVAHVSAEWADECFSVDVERCIIN